MPLLSPTTVRGDVDAAFSNLRTREVSKLDELLRYDRTTEDLARQLSNQLPQRLAGQTGILRDGVLKKLRGSVRQAMEGMADEHINNFRDAACHEPLEARAYEPRAFAVAAPVTPAPAWRGVGAAAIVFVAGIAVTLVVTEAPEDGDTSPWRILGVGASVALAVVAALFARQTGSASTREGLIEQLDDYLNRERPRVESWLRDIQDAYEACASPYLPSQPSGSADA
ncbi:MAG: hypothetical protein RhofKO_39430 [Rhodothermales bacterium]